MGMFILNLVLCYHLLFSIMNIYHVVHPQSGSDSSDSIKSITDTANFVSSLLDFDECNCFSVTLSSIYSNYYDPSINCYSYDIKRKLYTLRCYFSIDDVILSICDKNDINDLQFIYSSLIEYFPKYDDDGNEITISPYSNSHSTSDITGLLISMYIIHYVQLTLCFKGISTSQIANTVRFHRMWSTQICNNNDALPCLSLAT